jgi:DNA primase
LGTSLTEQQAMLLSRFAKKVIILFDGDLSGIKAALRAIGLLINAQVDVYVTLLPENSDPDNFIIQNGAEALRELLGSAVDFFHFYKRVVKTDTLEQEISLIRDLIQIIAKIQDPIRYDRYLKHVARVFDIGTETLEKEMAGRVIEPKKEARNTKISQEERLMAMILNGWEHFSLVKEHLQPDDFKREDIKRLFKKLKKEDSFDVANLSEWVDENLREKLLSIVMREDPVSRDSLIEAIKTHKGRIQKSILMKKISEAVERGDEAARQQYYKELDALKRQLLKIGAEENTNNEI